MDNSDSKKQKRMGPAPIASFEKSFEDNSSSSPSVVGISTLANVIGTDDGAVDLVTRTVHMDDRNRYDNQLSGQQPPTFSTFRSPERPKVSPPDPPPLSSSSVNQQQQQKTTVNVTPAKKLHDISGKKGLASKRPPPIQCVVIPSSVDISDEPTKSTLGVQSPSTPRIDISRASSSSQHEDSRESSPENVFEQVGTGQLQEVISIGFREEGALDLRSSTEELFFMDPEQKKEEKEKEKMQQTRKSPVIFRFEDHQTYLQQHQRKDSASSEVAALLCISGRTSRVSSVGSQGSAVSRLSAISGVSRSPSPHRMLMETSFCGPKPLGNAADGGISGSTEQPTAEILEQVLLSRKHDPTQVVLAEGIKIEISPKKKPLENVERKKKIADSSLQLGRKPLGSKLTAVKTVTVPKKDSSKQVVGVTPSGTEYIRINLKPNHLYDDKGIAPNERIVELASSGKPSTLKISKETSPARLAPSTSPKPTRHSALSKGADGSRSPSPANLTHSRKSSFCSLFKAKELPESPRDKSRSKSREKDRLTPQSQTVTPNKTKSVLAIFKPKNTGSKSKSSSPIDFETMQHLENLSQLDFKFNSGKTQQDQPRPPTKLRYYEDGVAIHIPLHTPPDEKDLSKIIKQNDPDIYEPSTSYANRSQTQNEKTAIPSKIDVTQAVIELPPSNTIKPTPKPQQLEKVHRIENLETIHMIPDDMKDKERTWSLEVHQHSSQESQDSCATVESTGTRKSKLTLCDAKTNPIKENGDITKKITKQISTTIQQPQQIQPIQPPSPPQVVNVQINEGNNPKVPAQPTDVISKEKKRILFATRIGSGSQEQIFSTQFSLSKTESLSSQLSEQASILESPAEGRETLHRSDTVIRRPEENKKKDEDQQSDSAKSSIEICRQSSSDENKIKSKASDNDEKKSTVIMRRKDLSEESRRKSKSNSEDDDQTRHSRYLANFDVQKQRFIDTNNRKKPQSNDVSLKESSSNSLEETEINRKIPIKSSKPIPENSPQLPNPPPPVLDRLSTDEPVESSESERDSEIDPNRLKQHLPRHLGAAEDHESTGLVSQESFDDELPYVPTTLPEERAQGVSLVPMKERIHMDIKTLSLDRPRSTTPMNPAHLEEYCGIATPDDNDHGLIRGEKLRISLPRKETNFKDQTQKSRSPRRASNSSGKSWFEFAEQGIRGATGTNTTNTTTTITTPTHSGDDKIIDIHNKFDSTTSPPPLPPRKPSTTSIGSGQWVNFDNIPERRKPPKRITALPKDSMDLNHKIGDRYHYVKPEECQCECHEVEKDPSTLQNKSISDVDLLQQGAVIDNGGEDLQPLLDANEGIDPSDSSQDYDGEEGHETDEQLDCSLNPNGRSSGYSDSHDSADERPHSSARSKNSDQKRYQ